MEKILKWTAVGICAVCLPLTYASSVLANESYTVAVLNFEAASTPNSESSDLGQKVTDLVTAYLSVSPDIALVERSKIEEILQELGLGLTGIVDQSTAAKIGKMVGADILITGRAFTVDEELFLTARAISVETSRVFVELEKGAANDKLSSMAENLAKKIARTLASYPHRMIGDETLLEDNIAALIQKLKDKKLPKISFAINETYGGETASDAACKTELLYVLKAAGFEVYESEPRAARHWAKSFFEDKKSTLPETVRGDVVIIGKAVAEFAARRGELVSSKGRVELRAVSRESGRVLAAARTTKTAVELSVGSAGRKALQEATADVAPDFLFRLVEAWSK